MTPVIFLFIKLKGEDRERRAGVWNDDVAGVCRTCVQDRFITGYYRRERDEREIMEYVRIMRYKKWEASEENLLEPPIIIPYDKEKKCLQYERPLSPSDHQDFHQVS